MREPSMVVDRRADSLFVARVVGSVRARLDRFDGPGPPTDDELTARIKAADAAVTALLAVQAADLVELRRRRLAQQNADGLEGVDADEHGWVVQEAAIALALNDRQAHDRVEFAVALQRHHRVRWAMSVGALASWTATRLVDHLEELSMYLAAAELAEVEERTVAWLLDGRRTVSQLNARMRRLLIKAKAAAGETSSDALDRHQAGRRVSLRCEQDGMAGLFASLPEQDGLALAKALDERARRPVCDEDDRTLAQRQADHLVALVTGAPASLGFDADVPADGGQGRGHVQVRLTVTVPAQSLVGADEPAEVPGYGPIPASTARRLAGMDDVWARPLAYDASTGRMLGLGEYLPATRWWKGRSSRITWREDITPVAGYAHPSLMEEFVKSRDRLCRAPGCGRTAWRCDCDHVEPYPVGSTSVENSCCLCRRHHRLKTHAPGWRIDGDPEGEMTWQAPSGVSGTSTPWDYRT